MGLGDECVIRHSLRPVDDDLRERLKRVSHLALWPRPIEVYDLDSHSEVVPRFRNKYIVEANIAVHQAFIMHQLHRTLDNAVYPIEECALLIVMKRCMYRLALNVLHHHHLPRAAAMLLGAVKSYVAIVVESRCEAVPRKKRLSGNTVVLHELDDDSPLFAIDFNSQKKTRKLLQCL